MSALLLIPWFRWESFALRLPIVNVEMVVHPFQLTTLIAIVVALSVAVLFARAHQRSVERTLDFAVHVLLFAFPISYLLNGLLYEPETLFYVLQHPSEVLERRLGWTSYGGVIGGVVGAWVWKWRRKASILETGDGIAFGVPFGWCIARMGCFVVHDHPGRVSDFALAVADYRVGVPPFLPRHDLGLYDAMVLGAIAIVFLFLSRSPRKPGFYLGILALLHAPCRFVLDFLRAPLAEGGDVRYAWLTPSQYVAIALIVLGIAIMRRVRTSATAPT